jgi:hypothetical protein
MKHLGSLISKLAAGGVALVVSAMLSSAQAQQEGTATVTSLRGSAQYSDAGGAWSPLKVGKVLKAGSVVKTAADSQVDLFLKQNGPVVRVTADTTLGLDKILFDDTGAETVVETQLNLVNGRILGNVKKLAAASRYEVKVPTGTVGIRGTEYDISASGIVHVVTGEVLVTYVSPSGKVTTMNVKEGEWFIPPTDAAGVPTIQTTPPTGWSPEPMPPVITGPGIVPPTVIVKPIEVPVSPIEGKATPVTPPQD